MKLISILLILGINLFGSVQASCTKSSKWFFFDLGDTIIDTKGALGQKYMPGALEYLNELLKNRYCLGLISNIPISWGRDHEERFNELKKIVESNWEVGSEKFQWDIFEVIFLPESESDLKPNSSMFLAALKLANDNDAQRLYFQGENEIEILTARHLGFIAHLVKVKNGKTRYLELNPSRE